MVNIHDSGYKVLFSNRTIFRQLIETFVAEPWVREADFDQAETLDKSFISEHYKATEGDLIYKVPLKDSEVYIYVLLELQSGSDRFMALRVLNYLTNFYMDYYENHKNIRYLPPVFPIVLYNGNARWTAPTRLEELIERPDLAGRFGVSFEYFKIAENDFKPEDLLKFRNIVSTLFLAESHYDLEVLIDELSAVFTSESDRQAVSLFINWFLQLANHGRIESSDVDALNQVYSSFEEVQPMLIESLAKERQKIREQAIKEGREEGREKGREEGREEGKEVGLREGEEARATLIAQTLLARDMSITDVAEITGLSRDKIEKMKQEL